MIRLFIRPLGVVATLAVFTNTVHANLFSDYYQEPIYAPQPQYQSQYQPQYQPRPAPPVYYSQPSPFDNQPMRYQAAPIHYQPYPSQYPTTELISQYSQPAPPPIQYQQPPLPPQVRYQHANYRPAQPMMMQPSIQPHRPAPLPTERRAILELAYEVLGVRYKYGGNSVNEGFDCSSLVQYSHQLLNRKVPRTAAEQSRASRTIARQQLRPGDLIFFNTTGKGVSHVGIYIKNGDFIHAASGGGRVMVDNLSKNYWQKRIVKYGTFAG